jgi:cytochrome b6-f complex iron-sulfur subunit
MNRTEFLKTFGTGAVAVCAGCSLESCSNEDINPVAVDITIDISLSANASLQNVGGSLVKDNLIIARVSSTEFVALAKACTHQGTTVTYEHANSRFHCANHGSNFSVTGTVINGPAQSNLRQYNTELVGTNLRIF